MSDETRIDELLDRWEELRDQGKSISPEELCHDCPELIEAVREQIAALQWVPSPVQERDAHCGTLSFVSRDPQGRRVQQQPVPETLGRYRLQEPLGAGGFGQVWRALDPELKRSVAIKIPQTHRLPSGEDIDRFLEEARKVAQLKHPGIVPVFDVGREGKWCYFVSELIDGTSLAERLAQQQFSRDGTLRIVGRVANLLHHAHEKGFVHRDVKPANILLDKEGTVFLTDFGIAATRAQLLDAKNSSSGTPAYMSPEQAQGQGPLVDARTDVYSLGVVLFEMLTGERPFRGNVPMLLKQVVEVDPPSPRTLDGSIPADLETICLKCLAKDPNRRYGSARELADELSRYERGEPILARPVGRLERTWKWCRRKPIVSSLLFAVIMLIVATALVSTLGYLATSAALSREKKQRAIAEQAQADEVEQREKAELALKGESEARRQTSQSLYFSYIKLAHEKWINGHTAIADAILDRCLPEHRNWEWYYLKRRCNAHVGMLEGLSDSVNTVAYSSNGEWIAGAGGAKLKVWDAASGEEHLTLECDGHPFVSFSFSPDGKQLAALLRSASPANLVVIWDVATGSEVLRAKSPGLASNLAFSPNGEQIAVASGALADAAIPDGIRLYDARNPSKSPKCFLSNHAKYGKDDIRALPYGGANVVAFSVDGRYVISAGYSGLVRAWDVASGSEELVVQGAYAAVNDLECSPDGLLAAVATNNVIRVLTGKLSLPVCDIRGHTDDINCIAFSPNGESLASGSVDKTIRLWDMPTGIERSCFKVGVNVRSLAFSPDGLQIASGGDYHVVKIWDIRSSADSLVIPHAVSASDDSVTLSRDGSVLATAGCGLDPTVKLWNSRTGANLATLSQHAPAATTVAFDAEGRYLVTHGNDDIARMWSIPDNREVLTLGKNGDPVLWACCSAGGRFFAAAQPNSKITIWEPKTGRQCATMSGWPLGFAPTGARLLYREPCTASDGEREEIAEAAKCEKIRIRNFSEAVPELTFPTRSEVWRNPIFSSDGVWFAVPASNGNVEIWNSLTGSLVSSPNGHSDSIEAISFDEAIPFDPCNTRVATAGGDAAVIVSRAATGEELCRLVGHSGPVHAVAFSPDGNRIATSGADKTLRVWNASDGQEILALRSGDCDRLIFSPDGEVLISRHGPAPLRIAIFSGAKLPNLGQFSRSRTPNPSQRRKPFTENLPTPSAANLRRD